jgi:hypothetical protein
VADDSAAATTTWQERLTSPAALLAAACLFHAVLALAFVVAHHLWWEQDETVYLSQVAGHKPALNFTPPRARGLPVLLFPMVHFTVRVALVRVYVVVLGTVAMFIGFRTWVRLGFGRLVAGAALLFSLLWTATLFGAEAQPNFTVAMLSVAVAGYFLLAVRENSGRRYLLPLAFWVALLALIRPSDATWMCIGLGAAMLVMLWRSQRRSLIVGATLIAGLVLGWSEWVIEAYASYGGFFHRLHEANADNTPGLHFSLLTQASVVNGPTLCKPCHMPVSVPPMAWWFAIPPLILIALLAARGTKQFAPLMVATVAGTALLAEYTFTVAYGAPRFLLPSYALYALPVAYGLGALLSWRSEPAVRYAVAAALVVLLGVQAVTQNTFLRHNVSHLTVSRNRYLTEAAQLHQAGVHAPCVIYGTYGPPVAFQLGCNDHPRAPRVLPKVATGTTVAEMTATRRGLHALPSWQTVQLFRSGPNRNIVAHVRFGGAPPP